MPSSRSDLICNSLSLSVTNSVIKVACFTCYNFYSRKSQYHINIERLLNVYVRVPAAAGDID